MKASSSPVAKADRIVLLDVLRGLAVFGILMVNMPLFFQPMVTMLQGYSGSASTADFISEIIIKVFFEGKFYVMFSMLFGYGFYLFMHKSAPTDASILPVFRRRIFFLLLFGVLHVVLLWPGDILIFYALFGFVLLLFRHVSDRGLIRWAVAFSLIPVVLTTLFALFFQLAMMVPEAAEELERNFQSGLEHTNEMIASVSVAYTSGSFSDIAHARIKEWRTMLPGVLFFYPMVLAMFLTGFWAARRGLMKHVGDHLPFFRKARLWGLAVGLPTSILYYIGYINAPGQSLNMFSALSTAGHIFGGFFLSLAYISTIVLLIHKGKLKKFSYLLAPVGRMALTNYLLHSIICTTIFLPYGLGLFGKITHWQGIILVLIIFGLQIPFSRWWLSKFRFGPFEWLWRSLTYLKWQPFIIRQIPAA